MAKFSVQMETVHSFSFGMRGYSGVIRRRQMVELGNEGENRTSYGINRTV